MNNLARLFLVLLRLAIGWHFLFEGMHKIHSHLVGPTETTRPFSSEPYFRDADGPLGDVVRKEMGIANWDKLLADKLTPKVLPRDGKPGPDYRYSDAELMAALPDGVNADWDAFVKRFAEQWQPGRAIRSSRRLAGQRGG